MNSDMRERWIGKPSGPDALHRGGATLSDGPVDGDE
jgi:hypothetical protein